MRILLFGRNGQLGWELNRSLPTLGELIVVDYPEVDFNQPQTLPDIVRHAHPDVIVNAVAYTNVDKAEAEPEIARRVNADAVGEIARAARELGALLVHISTDYVFDGRKGSPYVETDTPNPLNVYGRTKLEGEQQVEAAGGFYWIFRTSWVYSNRAGGFVNKVLEWARTKNELRIVDDQVGSPTWCRMLSELTGQALARFQHGPGHEPGVPSGIYHVAGAGAVSRYEWVKEILRLHGREDITVLPAKTAEFPTPAERPLYSALDVSAFSRGYGLQIPSWRTSNARCLDQISGAIEEPKGEIEPISNDFQNEVRKYLRPYESNFNYQNMLQGHLDFSRFYPWVDQVNQYKAVAGARVLSSGCGSGGDLYAFADRGAARVTGIEIDFNLAKLANLRLQQSIFPERALIVDYSGSILPFVNDGFDIVMSLHVLEHTQDPKLYLQELFRVLSLGGIIFIDIPSRYYKFEQHTGIKFIHYFPTRMRNLMIRVWKKFLPGQGSELKYKISTLIDFKFLAPIQIHQIFADIHGSKIVDSYLHSYTDLRINFPQSLHQLSKENFTKMTTYRLIIQKIG